MFHLLQPRARRLIIAKAIEEWYFAIQHTSPNTQYYYRQTIRDFTSKIQNKSINAITTIEIQHFLNHKLWGRKKSTVNKYLCAIRVFCRFLSENYNILNPAAGLKKFKTDLPYQPFITKEQYEKILSQCTQRESDILKMLANGGFRVSELCSLTWSCVSPQLTTIRFVGKGGKVRTVPINRTIRELISRYPQEKPFLNLPKNRKNVYNLCRKAGGRCNIALAPHMLRRYFATQLLDKGVSLLIISRLLGHSSVQITEQYLHLDSSYLYGATDCLD